MHRSTGTHRVQRHWIPGTGATGVYECTPTGTPGTELRVSARIVCTQPLRHPPAPMPLNFS